MKMILAAFAALLLAGCATAQPVVIPATPAPVASGPTIGKVLGVADEKVMLGVEASYRATLLALNAAVDAGVLKGDNAAKALALKQVADVSVKAARSAYDAGNSPLLMERITDATAALGGLRKLIGR